MTKNIVLLDDDPDEEHVVRDAFSVLGVSVRLCQFYTSTSLLDFLDKHDDVPEILLIDVNLPGENGLEFLQQLQTRSKYSGILTVIYTNAADDRVIAESFKYGAGVYMKKTNTVAKLAESLNTLLTWNTQTISELPIRGRTFRD